MLSRRHFDKRLIGTCLLLCVLLAWSARAPAQPQAQQRGGVDWIFVLDTSASMRGAGGARDIFGQVTETLKDFVRGTHEGDSVTIYTFDTDTTTRPTVRISDETDKRDLLQTIDTLQANGAHTHTGKAIRDALDRAAELGRRSDAAGRRVSIVLLTDGKEDTRGIPNPVSIPSNLDHIPADPPYLFYVSLGEYDPTLGQFIKDPKWQGRTRDMPRTTPADIEHLSEEIRKVVNVPVPATPTPTPVLNLTADPAALSFGQVERGTHTGRLTLNARSDTATRARLTLDDPTGTLALVEPQDAFDLPAGKTESISVRLSVAATASEGPHTAALTLAPVAAPAGVEVHTATSSASVRVYYVPVWRRLLKWLALLLILLILLLAAVSVVKGEPPWVLWRNYRTRNHLEGELEIIQPRPAQPEEGFINLAQTASERVVLSAVAPAVTTEADAELATVRRDKRKQILLRTLRGTVRVNKIEGAEAELYDGDLIELGAARLRFNWIGHERPVPNENP